MNKVAYNKLLLEADEAEYHGFDKLAYNIKKCLSESNINENSKVNSQDKLLEKVQEHLWKSAMTIIDFYDAESVDSLKINNSIKYLSEKIVDELKSVANLEDISVKELPLPGEINSNVVKQAQEYLLENGIISKVAVDMNNKYSLQINREDILNDEEFPKTILNVDVELI